MTAASGVPPWARPVLEELRNAARWMRVEVTNEHEAHAAACKQRVAWLDLEGCCARLLTATLAAGTPEGELCAMCGALLGEGEARCFTVCEPCWDKQYRSAAPPTTAPETSTSLVHAAPDAELDRLLIEYARCQVQARYASRSQPEINRRAYEVEWAAAAIRAHVARLVDEAEIRGRSAALAVPAPRDASGETARDGDFTVGDPHLNQLLYAFANQWLNVGRAPNGAVAGGYDYSDRMATLGAIQRLYRAATGEVVGCAQVIPHWEDGDEYCPDMQILRGWLPTGDTQPYAVDLVRRRDKEGRNQ